TSPPPATLLPIGDILADIKSVFDILNNIATDTTNITAKVSDINSKLDSMDECLDEMENRISHLEDNKEGRAGKMANLDKKFMKAWDRIKDLENRSRRSNICIMVLPEVIEEGKPMEFLSKFLPEILDLPSGIEIERAHRSLAPCSKPSQRLRPIIMCLPKYQTRELILLKAREKQNIVWENHKLAFFQDLSKEVQQKRRAFLKGKQLPRDHGVKYSMAYQATLGVHHEGLLNTFQTLE
uniref:L1 transposable element RRM domain-containing protein n=1 Tax=Latimeria chalumnae TaxID=7897 RepID=H3AV46_LATCH